MGKNNIGKALEEIMEALQGGKVEEVERVDIGKFTPEVLAEVRKMIKEREAMEAELRWLADAKKVELLKEIQSKLSEYVDGLKDSELGRRYDAEAEKAAALLDAYYNGLKNLPADIDKDMVQFDIRNGVIFYEKEVDPANG